MKNLSVTIPSIVKSKVQLLKEKKMWNVSNSAKKFSSFFSWKNPTKLKILCMAAFVSVASCKTTESSISGTTHVDKDASCDLYYQKDDLFISSIDPSIQSQVESLMIETMTDLGYFPKSFERSIYGDLSEGRGNEGFENLPDKSIYLLNSGIMDLDNKIVPDSCTVEWMLKWKDTTNPDFRFQRSTLKKTDETDRFGNERCLTAAKKALKKLPTCAEARQIISTL